MPCLASRSMAYFSFSRSRLEDSGTTGVRSHGRPARTLGRGIMINRICARCSAPFRVKYPSTAKRYCSKSCSAKDTSSKRDYRGEKNPKWRGGRILQVDGRIYVYAPDHPLATKAGYVYEYRLAAEKVLGRTLSREEIVHHVNADPSTAIPGALAPITQGQHAALEAELKYRDPITGFRRSGVHYNKRKDRWRARVTYQKKEIHLGTFRAESAARAAVQAFWSDKPILAKEIKPCA